MSEASGSSRLSKASGNGGPGRAKGSVWQWLRNVVGRRNGDPSLRETIEDFRQDELEHRDTGLAQGAEETPGYRPLTSAIKAGSRLAIWLSERV